MKCRHCIKPLNLSFLDLGSAPPSNAYLTQESLNTSETYYPLRLLVCEYCWLVQTDDYAGRESLFNDNYAYFSSCSTSWLTHAQSYVNSMINRFCLNAQSRVVEVASNDGYLLQFVQAAGIPNYGIEPTSSIAQVARDKGLEIIDHFFGVDLADELVKEGKQADLMVANNVLAHVPDINDFVAGFSRLLKPQGVATFEFPHLLNMVYENQFDTAYHEHYSYLSLTSVNKIFYKNGLTIFDVEQISTHGGSLRVYAQRTDIGNQPVSEKVGEKLKEEANAGTESSKFYEGFQIKAENIKDNLLAFLLEAKRDGKKVGAYSAAAKGNTVLNYAGVKPDLLPFVCDAAQSKQGKYLPGSHIPIFPPEYLEKQKPDFVLILAWNLRHELMHQLDYIRAWGGKFVFAVPKLEII